MTDAPNYKKTLNLPATDFPMKANLVQNEPASMKRWDKLGLYQKLRERDHPKGPFVAHDGPPYANGDIHLGHLLNKVLKDLVVRSRSMLGYDCPYTPGWDCHGLPIEHKVMQEMQGATRSDDDPLTIRKKCAKYANKYVKTQSKQMQRLLTLADYEDPYLTMLPKYEAGVLEVFAGMIDKGLVYRDLKPVHWSIDNQTALAEAELEYYDKEDTSVYVRFNLTSRDRQGAVGSKPDDDNTSLMIWTTTPWTLPANLAVAVHPRMEYGLYSLADAKVWMAISLAEQVAKKQGLDIGEPHEIVKGEALVGLTYEHPFIDRQGKVVAAEYVTAEDGTGLVHTAPGHGAEDYQTGLREGLDVYCPVRGDGTYDDTVPDWLQGQSIWKANEKIVERLRESGHLFHSERFTHSYPHDWRGKKPVIFRATEQWFVAVDKEIQAVDERGPSEGASESADRSLRDAALAATESNVDFFPAWGRNRMRGMLESRPDWCVSRQRAWGLPIPAFFNTENQPLLTAASVATVAKVFAEKGSDSWFYMEPHQLLAHYDWSDEPQWVQDLAKAEGWPSLGVAADTKLNKGSDTFDVWFESGSSWNAVLREAWSDKQARTADGAAYPADLYLEGSDQHRGWFQHSLLPALAVTGQAPFRAILTHGFMVDKDGRKMSKSGGNALNVDDLLKNYGADVCRWWVSSLNPDNDIKADASFFKLAGESYRKIRNTLRFILSNLGDYAPPEDGQQHRDRLKSIEPTHLEAWLLDQFNNFSAQVTKAYENYAFREAHLALFDFCNDTLSAVYLAAVKDRLYCDTPDAPRRRRAQAALYEVADGLTRLLAPMLPHTADEAARSLPGRGKDSDYCVHLQTVDQSANESATADDCWPALMQQRDTWLKALESARQDSDLDNPLDTAIKAGASDLSLDGFETDDLADLCGVSRFGHDNEANDAAIEDLRETPRCDRCWKRPADVSPRSDGGHLCSRCAAAVGIA
jgi:isoleucyl-tRNA synthetase